MGSENVLRYTQPVPVPNRESRLLFLVGSEEMILLEFRENTFRFVWLGVRTTYGFGGETSHALHYYDDAELLVLQNVNGALGMGRGASGSACTWLQIFDIKHDKWLVNTPIGWYNTRMGYEDENGANQAGGEQTVSRRWQLRAHGRTLRLGGYQVQGKQRDGDEPDSYATATLTRQIKTAIEEDATLNKYVWRSGTYHLLNGQYQRVAH